MEIKSKPNGKFQIREADQKEKGIDKTPRMMGTRGRKVSQFEESLIRSQIGAMQWFVATSRPDLCYLLNIGLSRINAEKDAMTVSWTSSAVQRFKNHRNSILKLVPLRGQIKLETYGDSALAAENNRIGVCIVLRQAKSNIVNMVGWHSCKSNRRAWSTLAAETHAMQLAIDRAIGLK